MFGSAPPSTGVIWITSENSHCRLGAAAPYTTRGNGVLTNQFTQRIPVAGGFVTVSVTTTFTPLAQKNDASVDS
jgi:hypothetical protein